LITKAANEKGRAEIGSLRRFENISFENPFPKNRDLLDHFKSSASCLFVPNNLDLAKEGSGLELSFPSKLMDFVQTGLPVLITGCGSLPVSKWAVERKWTAFLDEFTKEKVTEFLNRLICQDAWSEMARQSREAALNEFDPDRIHRQFESELAVG
jgi:hypothetical protein